MCVRARGADQRRALLEVLLILLSPDDKLLPIDEADLLRDLGAHASMRRVDVASDDEVARRRNGDAAADGAVGGGLQLLVHRRRRRREAIGRDGAADAA